MEKGLAWDLGTTPSLVAEYGSAVVIDAAPSALTALEGSNILRCSISSRLSDVVEINISRGLRRQYVQLHPENVEDDGVMA